MRVALHHRARQAASAQILLQPAAQGVDVDADAKAGRVEGVGGR